jgi:hypothetical protein
MIVKSATRVLVSSLGTLAGLAGIEHGIGEMLQGNVAPEGLVILSWPGSELFRILGGEPAMTIVPSLFVTGILAVLVSLVYILWATALARRKHSGLVLVLLSIVMLLVGAGFGTLFLGLIVGLAATRIDAPLPLPAGAGRILARVWPWSYAACVASWLLLLPGTIVLAYLLGTDNVTAAVPALILLAFGSMLVAFLAAFARDSQLAHESRKKKRDGPGINDRAGGAEDTAIV